MIDITKLSSRFAVRRLGDADADSILALCRENKLFYLYCEAQPSREQVLNDLHITPPGVDLTDKYYLGFCQGDELVAVMDLIDGYPEPDMVFIGFFMMNAAWQGRGVGSAIIREAADHLQTTGKTALRLGIDKANPQSTHFWRKNGFAVLKEIDRGEWTVLLAEKKLTPENKTPEKADADQVRLAPMTREMFEEYLKEYENDPDLYLDPEKYVRFQYSAEWVDRYLQRVADLHRIQLAILYKDEIVGEIVLKNIEPKKCATMGLTLKNASWKDRGIGTRAERLAVAYVFNELDIPVLYADSILPNTRSQHVLEKVGFTFLRESGDFRYYEIRRDPDSTD